VWSAECHWYTEALRRADCDVNAEFTGRGDEAAGKEIGDGNGDASGGMDVFDYCPHHR
jgi:hypothetical protein